MKLEEVVEKVKKHDVILDDHEKRIGSIEGKFGFIKDALKGIQSSVEKKAEEETKKKKIKFSLKNLTPWKIGLIIIILIIGLGAIAGNA